MALNWVSGLMLHSVYMTGIKGRSRRLAAIEYPTAPNTLQNTMASTTLDILDVSFSQPRMDGTMVGSSIVFQILGST